VEASLIADGRIGLPTSESDQPSAIPPLSTVSAFHIHTRVSTIAGKSKEPAIAAVIRANDLTRVTKTLKRELLGKLGKGDISYLAYRSKLDPLEREEIEAKQELTSDGTNASDLVLAFGPNDSAWKNGLNMAGYASILGLPWIVLALRDLVRGEWYGLLPVLTSAFDIAARWPLYGFFMGYYYAYLKGRFWFTMVTPAALATGLFQRSSVDAWQGLSFWAFQVFLTSMLLGLLAGDLQTLQRSGYRWRELLEFHNLAALSAWTSALVLALGTTITSVLASGLGTLVSAALQYSGVLPAKLPPRP
jgi:hypothetical protein